MDVKTILGLTSAIVGAGIVAHQDPSFEYPVVKPVLTSEPVAPVEFEMSDQVAQKSITVRFKDASASDVFDWLSNQGVSFVTSNVPKDTKITLNLNNVPLNEAIQAIGSALGGGWQRNGSVYVFQKGGFGQFPMPTPGGLRVFQGLQGLQGGFQGMDEAQAKKMEELAKEMEKRFGDNSEFAKKMETQFGDNSDFAKNLEKQFGEKSEFAKQMQKQFGPDSEFARQMKERGAKGQNQLDQKQMQELNEQLRKQLGPGSDFQKQMEKMRGQFGPNSPFQKELQGKIKNQLQDQKHLFVNQEEFQKALKAREMNSQAYEKAMKTREEALKVLEQRMKDGERVNVPPLNDKAFMPGMGKMNFSFGDQDLRGVVKSLTADQRAKNKKQGYLHWSDLTPDQQRKMGMKDGKGHWTITYSENGESFTVKSDPN